MLIDNGIPPPANADKTIMSLSAFSIQGKRNHMEDFFDIGYQMKPSDLRRPNEWPYEYFYFGIFDGHGGCEAARFAKKNLLKHITSQKSFWSNHDDDVKRAIRDGFAQCQEAMRKVLPTWNRTSRVLPSTAGTTASVLFIKNGKFYTGHVGDSRIVISKENCETKHWISQQVTEDHKPESKCEVERIERAGGEVRSKIGVHRVVWRRPVLNTETEVKLIFDDKSGAHEQLLDSINTYPLNESFIDSYQSIPFLAIARSLGDFWSLNPYSGQYIVSPEPDVSCRPIEADDKCILLATDGLWNVMNSSQVVRILQELNIVKTDQRQYHEKEYFTIDNYYDIAGLSKQNHAQSMVYFAYQIWERRRLRSDNITVVVAMLHNILQYFHRSNKVYATRASGILPSESIYLEKHAACHNMVQIGETTNYLEKIQLSQEPKLVLVEPLPVNENLEKLLESFLTLPPSIIEQKIKDVKFSYPKNYMRLSLAACRRISRKGYYGDSFIYIKNVSDDPADEEEMETRTSRSGKIVKDASAQATQCIHDFGQPWDQLLDNENPDDAEDDVENGRRFDDIEFDPELFDSADPDDDVEEEEYDDDKDNDDDEDEDEEELTLAEDLEEAAFESVKVPHKDKKSIPQLRCLLNYTPPLRRSTRSTYQSLSDNSKRKAQQLTNSTSSKRRKSQPIRCNLTRI